MKICLVNGAFPPINDGIGDYTAKLMGNLKNRNVEVYLITSDEKQVRDGMRGVPSPRIYPIIKKWNILGMLAIVSLAKKHNFNIVHLQFPSTRYQRTFSLCLLPLFLRMFVRGIRVGVTFHEFSVSYPINRLRQFILALFSHRVIITDEDGFNQFCGLLPWGKKKLAVIPIGSSIDVFDYDTRERVDFLKKLGLSEKTVIVSFFGVVHSNKGVECLLKAASRVISDGFPLHLVFISQLDSRGNAYHSRVEELIDFLGIKKSVFWTGYVAPEDASRLLSFSDICALPFTDGVTLRRSTLMAALTHRKAVVSTRSGRYIPRELVDGSNILLVPINDTYRMAEAIKLLCGDDKLRRRLEEAAGCLAKSFLWSKITDMHLDIYETLGGVSNGME